MNKKTCLALLLCGASTLGGIRAAETTLSPVGKWRWFTGPALTFDVNGAVTGTQRPAVWFWLDEDKHELQIVWGGPVPGLDKLTLSEDGKNLQGSNNDGTPVSGSKLAEAPAAEATPAPAGSAPAVTAATAASPVGTWSWFFGPNLTFNADGTITGENRTARWTWIDAAKRQLRIDFGGEWSDYHDTVTLSEDGKHLQGVNNVGMEISGDRIRAAPAATTTLAAPGGVSTTATKSLSPAGTWSWFVGPDLTFGADGTITGANRSAHWEWTDETKHELKIQWTGNRYGLIDNLALSDDGTTLHGMNNLETPVSGSRLSSSGSEKSQ